MENTVISQILEGGGMALALLLLFFYSVSSYKVSMAERNALRVELRDLQTQFHEFKDRIIDNFLIKKS